MKSVASSTPYDLFDLPPTATQAEIRAAHRRLIWNVHPDHGGSHALFRQVQEAYELLSDPVKRAAYDRSLKNPPRGTAAGPQSSRRHWLGEGLRVASSASRSGYLQRVATATASGRGHVGSVSASPLERGCRGSTVSDFRWRLGRLVAGAAPDGGRHRCRLRRPDPRCGPRQFGQRAHRGGLPRDNRGRGGRIGSPSGVRTGGLPARWDGHRRCYVRHPIWDHPQVSLRSEWLPRGASRRSWRFRRGPPARLPRRPHRRSGKALDGTGSPRRRSRGRRCKGPLRRHPRHGGDVVVFQPTRHHTSQGQTM